MSANHKVELIKHNSEITEFKSEVGSPPSPDLAEKRAARQIENRKKAAESSEKQGLITSILDAFDEAFLTEKNLRPETMAAYADLQDILEGFSGNNAMLAELAGITDGIFKDPLSEPQQAILNLKLTLAQIKDEWPDYHVTGGRPVRMEDETREKELLERDKNRIQNVFEDAFPSARQALEALQVFLEEGIQYRDQLPTNQEIASFLTKKDPEVAVQQFAALIENEISPGTFSRVQTAIEKITKGAHTTDYGNAKEFWEVNGDSVLEKVQYKIASVLTAFEKAYPYDHSLKTPKDRATRQALAGLTFFLEEITQSTVYPEGVDDLNYLDITPILSGKNSPEDAVVSFAGIRYGAHSLYVIDNGINRIRTSPPAYFRDAVQLWKKHKNEI